MGLFLDAGDQHGCRPPEIDRRSVPGSMWACTCGQVHVLTLYEYAGYAGDDIVRWVPASIRLIGE